MTARGGASFDARNAEERERVAGELLANRGGRRLGDEIHFDCPNEAAGHRKGGACDFNVNTGLWKCQGCGAKGHAGDLAKLLGLAVPSSRPAAPAGGVAHARAVKKPEKPAPKPARVLTDAELVEVGCYCGGKHQRPKRHFKLGEPSRWWFYHDADGAAQWAVLRFETKDDDGKPAKTFLQFDLEARTWTGPPEPRPLYRLEAIEAAPGAPVVLVEGEKCADALTGVGVLATSTMGGANGIGKADLRPLAGRAVYLWRDNDKPGEGWLAALLEALPAVGVLDVFVVPIASDKPEKWDAADAIDEGMDRAAFDDLVGQTEPAPKPDPDGDLFARMKVTRATDLPMAVEPFDEVVEGLIEARSLAVLYGASNTGKTFFALSLADAVARGADCYGRKVDPGVVVYLATESPGGVRRRIQATQRIHGTPAPDLFIVEKPLSFFHDAGDDDAVVEVVRAAERVAGKRARLVIGDTLARMTAGANENSGDDMGPVMLKFDRVAEETNAAVVIVHHMGKNQAAGARGWSGILAHISTEIEVDAGEDFRRATVTKQRDLDSKGTSIFFKLEVVELGTTKWGKPLSTCVAVPDPEAAARVPSGKKAEKRDERLEKFKKWIERAWWFSGAQSRAASPFIPREKLGDWLQENAAMGEKAAWNHMAPNGDGKLIGTLTDAGIVNPHDDDAQGPGWIIAEPGFASSLMLRRDDGRTVSQT